MTVVHDQNVIYLDNASTSWPKPDVVHRAMSDFLATDAANPGRGAHRMAVAAERMLDTCRLKLARLLNAEKRERIIFMLNTSDALNTAIYGVVNHHLDRMPAPIHVVTTQLEHNSVNRPLNTLEARGLVRVSWVEAGRDGLLDAQRIADAVENETVLVAFTHCSNVIGVLEPAAEIVAAVRARSDRAVTLLDAAQTVGVIPVDVRDLGIDLLAAPGHKGLLGPTGTGLLYVSPRVYEPETAHWRISNFRAGGTGGDSASPIQPRELPYYFETGTANTVGFAGLSASVSWLTEFGIEKVIAHERRLISTLIERLASLSGSSAGTPPIRVMGTTNPALKVGVVSLLIDGFDPAEASAVLDESFGIATRSGLHCAPNAHRLLGTFPDGTVRVSPGPVTQDSDMEALINALAEMLGR